MVATPKLFGGLLFSASGAKSAQADFQSSLPETSPAPASEVPAPASPRIRGRIQTRAKAKAKVAASPLKKPSAAEPSPKRRQSRQQPTTPLSQKRKPPEEAEAKPKAKAKTWRKLVGKATAGDETSERFRTTSGIFHNGSLLDEYAKWIMTRWQKNKGVHKLDFLPEVLTVVSGCAGSGMDAFICNAITEAFAEMGLTLEFNHLHMAETDKRKIDWLKNIVANTDCCIFDDCSIWASAEQAGNCQHHVGNTCPVARANLMFHGFSCKLLSKAYRRSLKQFVSNRLAMGKGLTGETFAHGIQYVMRHRPDMIMWENVDALLDDPDANEESNLKVLQQAMGELEYEIVILRLNSSQYALPQHRVRVVIMGTWIASPLFGAMDGFALRLTDFIR